MTTSALPRIAPRPATLGPAPQGRVRQPGWVERLAAWADRQPRHHHLGRWTAV